MIEEIPPEEVKELVDEKEDVDVIDVRRESKYRDGHIPGAENIPMNQLVDEIGEREWSEDIAVVCAIGKSSVQAARLIKSYEGVDDDAFVASMEGGYKEWEFELASEN